VLVDGPQNITGVHRHVITTKRLELTKIVATGLKRNASQKSLKAAWEVKIKLIKYFLIDLIIFFSLFLPTYFSIIYYLIK
jgi:hypothetical protein